MKPLFILLTVCSATAACLPVSGDRILGRDFALALPQFAGLPASLSLGYAPVPGTSRVYAVAELQRIAHANGIAAGNADSLSEICFEVPMHEPDDVEFTEALRRSLPPDATLRIAERSRAAIPKGRLEFPLSGMEPGASNADGLQLWRGFVQYTETRRIAVWARVSVSVSYTAVVALRDLPAATPIDADSLRTESRQGPLKHAPAAVRPEDVTGRVLRQPVKAGDEVPASLVADPPAIRRGDSVRVEVQCGLTILRFDAIATANARAGEMADLLNPATGKTLRARVAISSGLRIATAVMIVGGQTVAGSALKGSAL